MGLINVRKENKIQQQKYAARTGFIVDIQNIGKNTELIAHKQKKTHKEVRPGVWLDRSARTFKDGNFTNIYDLHWNSKTTDVFPQIHSSNSPYTLFEQVTNDQSILGVINGAFYFLADVADRKPHDLPYNFCIRDGILRGLPSSDEPVLYTRNGSLQTREPKARGAIRIGKYKLRWVGARSTITPKPNEAILYNSYSSTIIKIRDKKTQVQIGILDTDNITTPKDDLISDILVALNEEDKLIVTGINMGGGTHFYDGVFVLQVRGNVNKYNIGDEVEGLTLDGLKLAGITSGISVGKRIIRPLIKRNSGPTKRDARSVIAKDINGNVHFIVFDGSKYIPGFNGVSSRDLYPYFAPNKFKWAYFLDGGGSSRIILKNDDKFKFYANEFAFTKMEDGKHLWDWRNARLVASSISLKLH